MSTFLASAASASSTLMEDEDRHSSGSSYAPKGKLFGPLDKNVSKFSSDRNDGSAQMSAWLVSVDKAMRLNPQIYAGKGGVSAPWAVSQPHGVALWGGSQSESVAQCAQGGVCPTARSVLRRAVFSHSCCLRDSADACVPRARDQSEARRCGSTRSRAALGAGIVGRRLR